MAKFEYKFELNLGATSSDEYDHTEESLNSLGAEGWELVTVCAQGKGQSYLGFYFKRQIN